MILFKKKNDILPFIWFLGFHINKMLYLLFPKREVDGEKDK
jgi:hypothetical protein